MLETPRLILRQWEAKDRAPFAALNADSDVMRFFPTPLQKAESDNLVDRFSEGMFGSLRYQLPIRFYLGPIHLRLKALVFSLV